MDSSLRPTRSVSPYVRQQLAASYDSAVLEQRERRHTAEDPQSWQGHREPARGSTLRKTASSPWQPPARAVSRTLTSQPAPQAQHGPHMAHQRSIGTGTASAAAYVTVQPAGSHKPAVPDEARAAAHHELARLPSSPQVFSQLDWQVMSSILQAADQAAKVERLESSGNGQVRQMLLSACQPEAYAGTCTQSLPCRQITLLKLLKAYEEVLLLRGIDAESDTHYYRLLLQLSLDSSPDWWGKLHHHAAQWAR